MKVNIPIKKKDSIDLEACDLSKGLLLSNNPKGVIMFNEDERYYYFYKTSNYDIFEEEYTSLTGLVQDMMNIFPNITFEYFENE